MEPYFDRAGARLYLGDAVEVLRTIPTESVHCVVSSPPYNTTQEYGVGVSDDRGWAVYGQMVEAVAVELFRVLVQGGRVWWNVQPAIPDGDGRRIPLALWWQAALEQYLWYRDTVVWIQDSWDGACAWGSWCSPSAPNLRGGHELVLSYYKADDAAGGRGGLWRRSPDSEQREYRDGGSGLGGSWQDLCRNVWKIAPARSARPATFPVDLPARCIRLSTWPGEVVLDPFCGTGTTLVAAQRLGRRGVGIDLARELLDVTIGRLGTAGAVEADADRVAVDR